MLLRSYLDIVFGFLVKGYFLNGFYCKFVGSQRYNPY